MTHARPLVSVVSACRNEERTLGLLFASLAAQEQQDFDLEIIFAEGGSSDSTRTALEWFARAHPGVRVVDNPRRIASTGLNAAIHASRGSVIVRLDAHTEYAPDYVASCLAALQSTRAAMVGGPVRPASGGSYWQRATALAHRSRFFSGGSRVYNLRYEGPVDTVAYGCWPRSIIEAAGLFDESMVRNQDDELSLRIRQAGGTIWQSPSIRSWYHSRRSPWALARQFFGYGWWKVYTIRKHRQLVHARHAIPAAALLAGLALAALSPRSRLARAALRIGSALYATAVCAASVRAAVSGRKRKLLPGVVAAFPVAHFAYGAGTVCGLLAGRRLA